ncbi:YceD family protein [Salinarimonas sp. NSM]|uniref:YceD family protein n=1 Tax=Salinarimonas sp. NSM TaxID=3458003 RepID=UPI0040358C49
MTQDALPLSRLVSVDRLPARGEVVRIEATESEREALARDFGLVGIAALEGEYRVSGDTRRASVTGTVRGLVTQSCVVTLEPVEVRVSEEVDVDFAPASEPATEEEAALREIDPPDEIVDGKIDLGALTAEFLALGLDPYPRKPGVAFEPVVEDADVSPFDKLKDMKGPKGGG